MRHKHKTSWGSDVPAKENFVLRLACSELPSVCHLGTHVRLSCKAFPMRDRQHVKGVRVQVNPKDTQFCQRCESLAELHKNISFPATSWAKKRDVLPTPQLSLNKSIPALLIM